MKRRKSAAVEAPAIDLVEEAVHLLRSVPVTYHGIYAIGTLPFILGFLYFWADMSRGAFAREHIEIGALGMGLLFLWMKCWQAVYAEKLLRLRADQASTPWTARRIWQLIVKQSALQPSGLIVLPIASLVLIPFGWAYAFYQNLTAQGAEPAGIRASIQQASLQASTRSRQNHVILAFLLLFITFVWLNIALSMIVLPHLLKSLLGVDTAFTRSGGSSIFNTTYFACTFALTYVFSDPLLKAVYALRCFYGDALQTGKDLKSELVRMQAMLVKTVSIITVTLLLTAAHSARAATPAPVATPSPAVSAAELNNSIGTVLQRPEFAWRSEREEVVEDAGDHPSWFVRFCRSLANLMKDVVKYIGKSVMNFLRWLRDLYHKLWPEAKEAPEKPGGSSFAWPSFLRGAIIVLIAIIACVVAVLVLRLWRNRRIEPVMVEATVMATPDLNDENLVANQLPEDEWLRLAREMMAQGNLRLALRAFYLAGLAHLAGRELIALASSKSNREYQRELSRRARALPEVQSAFNQNVAAFERAWYGLHEVEAEGLQQFQANLNRIRA